MTARKIKTILEKDYVKSFIICFIIAFLSFLPFVIKGEGFFVLSNDFNDQQIPFTIGLHNALLDGGFSGYSWDIDLGTSTMDGFSFYELGSVFFWISMLFPANAFPYLVAWLFMLKFAFAGVTSCLYLRRFVKDSKWAVLGSVLYAFSGYSVVNMIFYHFHDAIIFFPLLLIGLERYKEKKDVRFFIFSIFINCIVNYFFFVGEVVFLVIYYLFRFASKDIKTLLMDAVKCVGCGLLGGGMAAVVFIPNIIFISGNPRVGSFSGFFAMLTTSLSEYMYILKTLLLPGEPVSTMSSVYANHFSSHGFYIPLFGLTLGIVYVLKKRDWLSRVILYCAIASFIPLLSDLFYMYSAAQMRWWYMFTLMVALASVRMLEEPERDTARLAGGIYIALTVVYVVAITVMDKLAVADRQWIFDAKRFYGIALIAVVGAVLTIIFASARDINYKRIFVGVSAFSLGLLFVTMVIYRSSSWIGVQSYRQRFEAATQIEISNKQYRLNDAMNLVCMTAHVAGFSNQSSTDTNNIRNFEALFDYYSEVVGMDKNDIPGLAELLAGKYYLSFDPNAGLCLAEYKTNLEPMYLMEREACPIGFSVDSFITKDELMSMDVNNRAIALLDSIVLEDEEITDEIKKDLQQKSASEIELDKSVSDYVLEHTEGSVLGFDMNGHGMSCVTGYENDTYVYFSVPYDEGWTATVDGEDTDIIVSGGMMVIKVPAGEHQVHFSYYTPGLKEGTIVSLICWAVFLFIFFYQKRGRKDCLTK